MQVRNRATLRAVYCEPAFIYAVFLKDKVVAPPEGTCVLEMCCVFACRCVIGRM